MRRIGGGRPRQPRERFVLTLESLPEKVPSEVRLRRLLKLALRAFGLRCVRVEPENVVAAPPAQKPRPSPPAPPVPRSGRVPSRPPVGWRPSGENSEAGG